MTTILRFLLFFLLAPAFAIVTQAAGAVEDDLPVVDFGIRAESVIPESVDAEIFERADRRAVRRPVFQILPY